MAFLSRLQTIRSLYETVGVRESSYLFRSSRGYYTALSNVPQLYCQSIASSSYKAENALPRSSGKTSTVHSTMAVQVLVLHNSVRSMSTQVKAPPQARQMGAVQVAISSPGIIYEPYAPRDSIPFWKRWFTRSGWRRTKEDMILGLKSAYAINRLRKDGYTKQKLYLEAMDLYKEINTLIANGDKKSLRKVVTEHMFSALKNEIKQRETAWSEVYWEMIEPAVNIRTLRARLIGVDKKNRNKVFAQLTLEFLTKQKFEAYNSKGEVVAGDKTKEVLVKDIWVFEKSLFHPGAHWRLCGRINL